MADSLKEMALKSVVAMADDARQRRAWKDGQRPIPPRIEWDRPVDPPTIAPSVEPQPEPQPTKAESPSWLRTAALASMVGLGAGGAGVAGMAAYHSLTDREKPPIVVQPAEPGKPAVDPIMWLRERGYDRSPDERGD